jgi:hypothetical protein
VHSKSMTSNYKSEKSDVINERNATNFISGLLEKVPDV